MSIVLGIISKSCAIVAGDGRVTIEDISEVNGVQQKEKKVRNDDFNKTFSLLNGQIIGCCAGLMEFEGKSIGGHLEEMTNQTDYIFSIDSVCETMKNRLKAISEDEVGLFHRKLDLVLIYKTNENPKAYELHSVRFFPNHQNTEIEIQKFESVSTSKINKVWWQIYGDDSARSAVSALLEKEINQRVKVDKKNLIALSKRLIRLGISRASKIKNIKTCGGEVFVKTI